MTTGSLLSVRGGGRRDVATVAYGPYTGAHSAMHRDPTPGLTGPF